MYGQPRFCVLIGAGAQSLNAASHLSMDITDARQRWVRSAYWREQTWRPTAVVTQSMGVTISPRYAVRTP